MAETHVDACMKLRTFQRSDLAEILRLEALSFADDPYPGALFLDWQRRSPSLFLVALGEGTIVGYVLAAVDKGDGRIISIAVDPSHRRRGVGRQLAEEALRRLETAGADSIALETRLDNEASIRLWRRLGFAPVGTARSYYEDGADALVMSRPSPS